MFAPPCTFWHHKSDRTCSISPVWLILSRFETFLLCCHIWFHIPVRMSAFIHYNRSEWLRRPVHMCPKLRYVNSRVCGSCSGLYYNEFTEGHQYRRTDGLVGTGLMPCKAHFPKYQHFMLFPVQFAWNMRFEAVLLNANFLISSLDLLWNNFVEWPRLPLWS